MYWVKKLTVSCSAGSTQKVVLAAPPQLNSPAEPRVLDAAGSSWTAKPRPNPTPLNTDSA